MDKHIYDYPYMTIEPLTFYKCLSDETRLNSVLLIHAETELCVCELSHALALSQPKISRHLAQLRECGLLKDRKAGQWVFYSLNPELPVWSREVIDTTASANKKLLTPLLKTLKSMKDRPDCLRDCCA